MDWILRYIKTTFTFFNILHEPIMNLRNFNQSQLSDNIMYVLWYVFDWRSPPNCSVLLEEPVLKVLAAKYSKSPAQVGV